MRLLAAGDCILWREISYCGLFNGNTGGGWAEQLRLTPSQLGGCSTAWYIICGRVGGETRTLIITETSAMAALLSALFSGSKRIRPALGIYMMTIAMRLALSLRTQIIIKNITAMHYRTIFVYLWYFSVSKICWPFWLLVTQLLCLIVTFLHFFRLQ